MKKLFSMCFIGDDISKLVLKREDWSDDEWGAFCKAFGLGDVDTIAFSEYKLEATENKYPIKGF